MTKILIAGEGGQGVQVIAEILAKAAFLDDKKALYIPNFGVEQRGGVSLAFVVIDNKPVVYPKFEKADILAILADRSIERVRRYINKRTKIVLGPAVEFHLRGGLDTPPRVWNILVLGKVNQISNLVSLKSLIEAMNERFAKQFAKNPELKELDLKALNQK